mgnify:CR=1 FL=1
MKYAIDYNEEKMIVVSWGEDEDEPEQISYRSFGQEERKGLPKATEEEFILMLKPEDSFYLLGTSVNETLCFIVAQIGVKVYRIFAPEFKKIKEELGVKKGEAIALPLRLTAIKSPDLFRLYIPPKDDDYLLRRWVRIHYRFQKRFRTGTQVTLRLLEKEVNKLQKFGFLTHSKAAAKVAGRIVKVLEYAQTLEDELLAAVEDSLKGRSVWEKLLKNYVGFGPKIASKIIASGPREKFRNRDHFIASAGLHVKNGMAVRRKAGESLLRESLLFDAFNQYMLLLHMHNCPERDQYRKKKQDYLNMDRPLWRADKGGRRWVGTHKARQFWRESAGLW